MKRLFAFIDKKSEKFEERIERLITSLTLFDRKNNKDTISIIFQNEIDNLKNQGTIFYFVFISFLVIIPIVIPTNLYLKDSILAKFISLYVFLEILILGFFLLFLKPIETSKYKKLIDRLRYDKNVITLDNESLADYIHQVSKTINEKGNSNLEEKNKRLDARTISIIIRLLRDNGHFPTIKETCSERAVTSFLFKITGYSEGMRTYIRDPKEGLLKYDTLIKKYLEAKECLNEIGYHNADNQIMIEIENLKAFEEKSSK